jgi:hypothetical protein
MGFSPPLSLERLQDVRLLTQHEPIRLISNIRQASPPLEIFSCRRAPPLGASNDTLRRQSTRHSLLSGVIHSRDDGTCLLKPLDLPKPTGADTLVRCTLVVDATGHWATMNVVDDARV